MDQNQIIDILRQGLMVALRIGGPMLIGGMAIGVMVAIFQAATQIHEQTLAFVPKLLLVIAFCLLGGQWMLQTLQEFTRMLFTQMLV
ncbi:MAG: flagellar biosynthesis protein FliQ [Agathobaculum sp.]|uniref:flagellar biosynthesis protein FliQ n=1 Tax=Agathobaculum sp. TaxID=2048138 RepID=UPI0025C09B54|nr:flagellar biosynthesis protein FliQ [Agathobaculum sp.]MCI7124689.1 flagellar biosynthesis protein FliQ [Agathobaculum sp.]MDY3711122.1 flagellar biosynthesis protein FliQ [Agathobaculum sp.]